MDRIVSQAESESKVKRIGAGPILSGQFFPGHAVDFILASTAIETNAVIVSDDRIFETIREFYSSLRIENWKQT